MLTKKNKSWDDATEKGFAQEQEKSEILKFDT